MRISALVPSLLIISVASLPGANAEDVTVAERPTGQLRLMLVHTSVYEVEETASGGSLAGSDTYTWQDEDPGALGFGLQYVAPFRSGAERPLLWGIELQYQHAEVEPDSYTSGGNSYLNTDHEVFTYGSLTAGAVLAWRFAQPPESDIGLIGELQVMLGVSVISGEISDDISSSDGAMGYGLDYSARVIFGLQERGWMGGVSAGLRGGFASIDIDHGTYTSELDLERNGVEVGFFIGHDL